MTEKFVDLDPQETQEWLDALASVVEFEGTEKAQHLINHLIAHARRYGIDTLYSANTPYINSIPPEQQAVYPGDQELEGRLRSLIRWNAMAMVVKANRLSTELGGHIASFASSATLYEVGFNHFFKGPDAPKGADMIFFQGHTSPGMYSRAFIEGRLTEEDLGRFRQEVDGNGLSSYPHPWLMPDFWQFPTVSMGLGPLMAIYQARFMKYLDARGLIDAEGRKVWAFLGDGETDEPESQGAIALAHREKLDNLVFVINCNLQRLDGPVRGNGKIIQELEGNFRGAGWNVLKVVWGSEWDGLLARDKSGKLMQRMMEVVDGEYQAYKARGPAYVREHFFGKYPETADLVKDMTDDEIFKLSRGGHDPRKIYAAYKVATEHKGQPTVILAHTVKGYGMGEYGEAAMAAHQQKKLDINGLRHFRDRFSIPISDSELDDVPFYKPQEDSAVMKYVHERRQALGGYLPSRQDKAESMAVPELSAFDAMLQSSGERSMSTTMAFVRILAVLLRDKALGQRIVPIIPDEARTFGMEGLFRQVGIYDPAGQLYEPVDSDQVMWYKQAQNGQVLQEGINEAGAMSSWIAAATAYTNHGVAMMPFYIYYSMFGYQRIGDLVWAAGDSQARGFLLGGTAGRTTLAGEGLQHQDGHNLIQFGQVPNCMTYDPTFAYELAVIVQDGLRRMMTEKEAIFYYVTVMNENYEHPALPSEEGIEEDILRGMYRFSTGEGDGVRAQLMGSGTILREVIAAAELLLNDFGVQSDVWSVTSFNLLKRDGDEAHRWNMLHPLEHPKVPFITKQLAGSEGPVIAATDYLRAYADQVRAYIPGDYVVLGTDGYGRSDTRAKLRQFFEVNRYYIVLATLKALSDRGEVPVEHVADAIARYGINPEKPTPWTV